LEPFFRFFNFFAVALFNATALYMWRSNVLRLRKCSSAAVSRYGMTTRWYSAEKSLPVDEAEFEVALGKVLAWNWNTPARAPLGT
jgi:hypothetical protein